MQTAQILKPKKPVDGYFGQGSVNIFATYNFDLMPEFNSVGGALIENNAAKRGEFFPQKTADGESWQMFLSATQEEYKPLDEFICVVRLMASNGIDYVYQDISLRFIKAPQPE